MLLRSRPVSAVSSPVVLFAAMVSLTGLRSSADSVGTSAAIGIGYGVLVWVVAAVIVMPIWLQAAGFPMAPALPNVSTQSLLGHVVFGLVLGALYPIVRNR